MLARLILWRWFEFVREPSAAIFVILTPILMMAGLGEIFSRPAVESYSVGIVEGEAAATERLIRKLADPRFVIERRNAEELSALARRGRIDLVLSPSETDHLDFWLIKDKPVSLHAKRAVLEQLNATDPEATLDVSFVDWPLERSRYIDFLVPGLFAMSVLTTSMFGTGMVVVTNRRDGVLKRLLATPMRKEAFLSSQLIGRLIVLAVEAVCVFAAAWAFFGFQWIASIPEFAVVAILGAMCFTSLALLCAARGENAGAINGIANILVIPQLLLAGIWFPTSQLPSWLQNISQFLPLTAFTECLRALTVDGLHLAALSSS